MQLLFSIKVKNWLDTCVKTDHTAPVWHLSQKGTHCSGLTLASKRYTYVQLDTSVKKRMARLRFVTWVKKADITSVWHESKKEWHRYGLTLEYKKWQVKKDDSGQLLSRGKNRHMGSLIQESRRQTKLRFDTWVKSLILVRFTLE